MGRAERKTKDDTQGESKERGARSLGNEDTHKCGAEDMRGNGQGRGRSRGENGALKMMDDAQGVARALERGKADE